MTMSKTDVQSPLRVGNNVFVRTVTHYHTGQIAAISEQEVLLVDAAWIAETDRWTDTLKTGALREVEPFPGPVSVARGAIVDVCDWTHPLPREQK